MNLFKQKGGEKTLKFYQTKEEEREKLRESQKAKGSDQFKEDVFAGESIEVQKEMENKREYIKKLERDLKNLQQRKMQIQHFNNSGQ